MKERLESIAYFDDNGNRELVAGDNDVGEERNHNENDSMVVE